MKIKKLLAECNPTERKYLKKLLAQIPEGELEKVEAGFDQVAGHAVEIMLFLHKGPLKGAPPPTHIFALLQAAVCIAMSSLDKAVPWQLRSKNLQGAIGAMFKEAAASVASGKAKFFNPAQPAGRA